MQMSRRQFLTGAAGAGPPAAHSPPCSPAHQAGGIPHPERSSLAYKFVEHAEEQRDFRGPARRMMRLLQTFREPDRRRYRDPANEGFRATFPVAELPHGFARDLRAEFRSLRFPIDDAAYQQMMGRMQP